jgi:hypothetical protein
VLWRWARYGHRARTPLTGEYVRAVAHASFRGACAASVRTTFSFAASRNRLQAFDAWLVAARAAGFAPEDPEMVLGVTEDRLVAWRTSFFLGRPTDETASLPLGRLSGVSVARHGLVTGVAFVVENGAIFEVEALRGRKLRRLADEIRATIAERGGRGLASEM